MQIGIIGLGRMGGNMAKRLLLGGHECVVYDRNLKAAEVLKGEGATPAASLQALASSLKTRPRVVWIMLPAGHVTEQTVEALADFLGQEDIVVDGGNSFYKDDIRRGKMLATKGIRYVDVGTSGGIWGLKRGYCMMIGGEKAAVDYLDPIFSTLAPGLSGVAQTPGREGRDLRPEHGYLHAGPTGAGHFVKMVHNGIEYGLMQAYAEGFDILREKMSEALPEDERFTLNMGDVAEVWRRGSVISSWLLDLCAAALAKDDSLSNFAGYIEDSGEGRWTIEAAIEEAVSVNVLAAALFSRFRSRREHTFGERLLAAMRLGFGGHQEHSVSSADQIGGTGRGG